MKLLRKIGVIYLAIYIVLMIWLLSKLIKFVWGDTRNHIQGIRSLIICDEERPMHSIAFKTPYTVVLWGDMKIAGYLWFDILDAGKDVVYKEKQFIFRTVSNSMEIKYDAVLLVGNGRSEKNILKLGIILDYLSGIDMPELNDDFLKSLKIFIWRGAIKLGLLMIGHEFCKNDWINKYLKSHQGILSFVFITYNAVEVSNKNNIYRWPLGVASYRNFPHASPINLNLDLRRPYFSNFFGTVYKNSSREVLVKELDKKFFEGNTSLCFLSYRNEWPEHEPKASSELYQSILKKSDFTLCPVGLNEETYRIYEALSMASIPIIEDLPPLFVTPEHANLINHCYSNIPYQGPNSSTLRNLPTCFIKYENKRMGLNFLSEEGSYYFDDVNGGILSSAGLDRGVHTSGQLVTGHQFLKNYKAPVLFVKKIDLNLLLMLRQLLRDEDILIWRKMLAVWYINFKMQMKDYFLDVIN